MHPIQRQISFPKTNNKIHKTSPLVAASHECETPLEEEHTEAIREQGAEGIFNLNEMK
jgi:hypothetical protein